MTPETFKTLRKQLGHSQQKMADALGISVRSVNAYERGVEEVPHRVALSCSALAFNLPPYGEIAR